MTILFFFLLIINRSFAENILVSLAIVLPFLFVALYVRRVIKRRQLTDESDKLVKRAIQNMDKVQFKYRDEEEANRELCSNLITLTHGNADVIYQPRYKGNNIGDIRLGNVVIEGKLDLYHKPEIDRLIGQVINCCESTPFKVKVVVYGNISKEAVSRINKLPFSNGRVSLICLEKANRTRSGYSNRSHH